MPLACYYTVVGDELSFRMLTPGDREAQRERYLLLPAERPPAAPQRLPAPAGGPQAAG